MNYKYKLIILVVLFTVSMSTILAIKPLREYRFYPERVGLIYKDIRVMTPDSISIKTWFYPAQEDLPDENKWFYFNHRRLTDEEVNEIFSKEPIKKEYKTIDNKRRPTIIICNGDAGNMSYQQIVFASILTAKGYNVVTFDWRGFGESSPWVMDNNYLCYTEMLIDYESVIEEVCKQPEVDKDRIALFGWSTGGYLSMAAASKNENVKALIVRAIPTNFEDIISLIKNATGKTDANLIVPKDYPIDLLPINVASTFSKSTLLIVGSLDDRTPVWMHEKIFSKLKGKKELWIVDGAKHGGMDAPEIIKFEEFRERIVCFLNNNL